MVGFVFEMTENIAGKTVKIRITSILAFSLRVFKKAFFLESLNLSATSMLRVYFFAVCKCNPTRPESIMPCTCI